MKLRDLDYYNQFDSDFCLSPILAQLDTAEQPVFAKSETGNQESGGGGAWRLWEEPRCLWELGGGRREGQAGGHQPG